MPRPLQLLGLAVGFAGTVPIFEPWRQAGPGTLPGMLACLIAAALYGVSYVYLARYVTSLPYNPVAIAAGQLAAVTALSLACFLSTASPSTPPLRWRSWPCWSSTSPVPGWRTS